MKQFTKREASEFNKMRKIFQWFVCEICVLGYVRIFYNYKVEGLENIPEKSRFIVAANHISGKDPFIVAGALKKKSVAFMAKEELFKNPLSRFIMNWCGAFAVKRDKVAVSTIKTALSIKNTDWALGLFPQGTRDSGDKIEKINKGFATFAKVTESDILPVALIGSDKKIRFPFSEKLTVKVGKLIPYSDNVDEMMRQWCSSISELTGKQYKLAEV